MLQVLSSAWALLLGIGLLMVGNGLQGTLLPVRAQLESFSPMSISLAPQPTSVPGACSSGVSAMETVGDGKETSAHDGASATRARK